MSPDDPGVMGNLPRSRPGRRSSKRGAGGDASEGTVSGSPAPKPTTAKAASSPKPTSSAKSTSSAAKSTGPAAKSTSSAKKTTARRPAKRTSVSGGKAASSSRTRAGASTAKTKPAPAQQPQSQAPAQGSTDPVTGAVMLAGKVVESGLKVAGGIIKRLPRP